MRLEVYTFDDLSHNIVSSNYQHKHILENKTVSAICWGNVADLDRGHPSLIGLDVIIFQ